MRLHASWILLILQPLWALALDPNDYVGSDGVIYADDALLERLFSFPRDYTVAVLLTTTNPDFGCQFCDVLGPSYHVVSNSWRRSHRSGDGLFFVQAEFEASKKTFKRLGLTSVPIFKIYPPTETPRGVKSEHATAEFHSPGDQIDSLVGLLKQRGYHVEIFKPFPWVKAASNAAAVAAVVGASIIFWSSVKLVLLSKQIWLAIAMVAILMFTAGHMFNIIRGAAFLGNNHGETVYFMPGFGNQFAVESQLVAIIYAALSFLTIALIAKVPKLTHVHIQTAIGVIIAGGVYYGYGKLMDVYRQKVYGYPYSLWLSDWL